MRQGPAKATPRETILTELHARRSTRPANALRGRVLPERMPAEGGASLEAAVITVGLHDTRIDPLAWN